MIVHATISAHGRLRQEDLDSFRASPGCVAKHPQRTKSGEGAGGRHGIGNSVEFYRVEILILGKVTSLW